MVFNQLKGDTLDLFYDRVKFLPGNGKNISLWEHDWGKGSLKHKIPTLYSFVIISEISLYQGVMTYHQLSDSFRPNMSGQALTEFHQLGAQLQQLSLIPHKPDDIYWADATTGAFSVSSAYRSIKRSSAEPSDLSRIWKLKAPPRMIIFGWLAIRNRILTHDNLNMRGCIIVSRCTLCKTAAESVHHLFHVCSFTREVYTRIITSKPSPNWPSQPFINITDTDQGGRLTATQRAILLIMQFIIWREICARSFAKTEKKSRRIGF